MDQKRATEQVFNDWAKNKPEFARLLEEWEKNYAQWRPYSKHRVYITEGLLGSPLMNFAVSLQALENALVKSGGTADIRKAVAAAEESRKEFIESENTTSDRNILGKMLQMYYEEVDKNQHPIGFFEGLRAGYGGLSEEETYKKYAAQVFSATLLLNDEKWKSFTANPDGNTLQNDLAYQTATTFLRNWQSKYFPNYQQFIAANSEYARLYLKGIIQMDTVKAKKMYPDATLTMRVSFGNVKSYDPRDAIRYDHITTMSGVLDKYKPGDYEFDLPENVLELARKKDFGPYADPMKKDLVVGFITTNDITGGNSGSPVLNANGQLIGLAFDGNYEALSHKIAFDKNLNRTICVDVRYILWCIDKVGGAPNIIKELTLAK
jgi:hypothetical protein